MFNLYTADRVIPSNVCDSKTKQDLLSYYDHYDKLDKIISCTYKTMHKVNRKLENEVDR